MAELSETEGVIYEETLAPSFFFCCFTCLSDELEITLDGCIGHLLQWKKCTEGHLRVLWYMGRSPIGTNCRDSLWLALEGA